MAHLLSSAVSVASSKLRSNTDQDHHQPGLSPPLSPSAQTDIELLPQPLPTLPPRLKQPTSSTYDTTSAPFSPPYPNLDTTLSHTTPSQEETDPLLLRSRLVEENEVRRRHSGKGRKIERDIKRFYQAQNEHIERLLKPMSKHASDQAQDKQSSALKVKIAIYGSILANFTLAGLQLYAAISSLSLSLFATAADSVFDPFANLVLNWLHSKSQNADERKWPIGGSRFESIGNISYAFLMGMVSAILIVQSIQELARNDSDKALHIPSLVAVGIAFLTKLSLAIYCYGLRKYSSQVEVLYQDHRNDLGINGFGIFTSAAGATIAGWIDPLGAMLISIVIIASWTRTCYHQFRELAGAAAPVEFLQLITYNSAIFSQEIQAIESVRAYSSGPRYIVEIDIVMHPETPLWKSHDLSQALQDSLEDLPMVERAFIHVDHEVEHAFEHRKLI
ncbi:hypothetical protein IE53DRAFT_405218 [Violaceomyces palustris]|uniref:Uncharacterized protein n=1 Tax=Violaceomyces palustris TaxID=1673888 RepID=A0ACD0P2G0_9BASI|nr:hypothetical protein IE53DRAFT_405218 [Violaceomyces palustris]